MAQTDADGEGSKLVSPNLAPPSDAVLESTSLKDKDVIVATTKAAAKQLEKEAFRLRISSRRLFLSIAALVIGLTVFWVVGSGSERKDAARQDMVTLRGANKFTINKLGEARERLASKTDSTFYEFLSDHHDMSAFQVGSEDNVVKLVVVAIEHESAQTGIVLVVQLFSDLFNAWPEPFSEQSKKRINQMIKELNNLPKEVGNTETDGTADASAPSVAKKKVERIRESLKELKEFNDMKDLDEASVENLLGTDKPEALASFLQVALDINNCRPYLEKFDRIRIEEMHGKAVIGRQDLRHKHDQSKSTTTETKQSFVPSEQGLLKAAKAIAELEAFVNDKAGLNSIIRSLILVDVKND